MAGGLLNGASYIAPDWVAAHAAAVPEDAKSMQVASAIGHGLMARDGSPAAFQNTITSDPAGAAMDVGTLAMGGESALARMGMEGSTAAKTLRTIGSATNPVTPIAAAAGKVGNVVSTPFRGRFAPQSVVDANVQDLLSRADVTPEHLVANVGRAAQEGQPMFNTADALGKTGREALSTVARRPSAMQETISDTLENRQAGQSGRVGQFVRQGLGANETADQATARLTQARGNAADINYNAARTGASPVDLTDTVNTIDDLVGPDAKFNVGIDPDTTEGALLNIRSKLATGNGRNGLTARSDFENILRQKADLKDKIDSLYRDGKNNQARALNAVYQKLDAALAKASQPYRTANDTFAQMSRPIDAVQTGGQAYRPSTLASDNIRTFNGLDPAAQAAFRTGYADSLLARIEASPPTRNVAGGLLADKYGQELGAFAHSPGLLGNQLERENTMFRTGQRALSGSASFDNFANDAGAFSGWVRAAAHGKTGLLGKALDGALGFATGQSPAVREGLAKVLLSNDPASFLNPLLGRKLSKGRRIQARDLAVYRALLGAHSVGQVPLLGGPIARGAP